MKSELAHGLESHPKAFEYIHRGCFLGTFDSLDAPESATGSESGAAKLPAYQNKFRLLSKDSPSPVSGMPNLWV